MRRMVGHVKGAADNLGDPPAGPELAAKPVGLCPALQQGGELGQLFRRESRLPARRRMAPQPLDALLDALLAPTREPLADGARRDPERGGDVLLFPAVLLQLPGASPPSFAPVQLGRLRAHGVSVASL